MEEIENSIGLRMIRIPAGTFLMGSPGDERGRAKHERQHYVTLRKDFFIGVSLVTLDQWLKVLPWTSESLREIWTDEEVDSLKKIADPWNYPMSSLSWEHAVLFCDALNKLDDERQAGRVYRLPTEAEWEYSCRAGSTSPYFFGEKAKDLERYAIIESTVSSPGDKIMTRKPNAWGLYDMQGLIFEWCHDWLAPFDSVPCTDPTGPATGIRRVLRGGVDLPDRSFYRSATRFGSLPFLQWSEAISSPRGFRVVMQN